MKKNATKSQKSVRKSAKIHHRFGCHCSIAGGVFHALEEALSLKCDVVQVFVKNQRQWKAPPLKAADVDRWHELLATKDFGPAIAHATYLINLASSDNTNMAKSRLAFLDELRRCDQLSIPYLVVHPGAAGTAKADKAMANVSAVLNSIFAEAPEIKCKPLLETTAGQGTSLGRSFAELGQIIDRLDEPERVGICIDTCHVFAAGYDIRDKKTYADMIKEADESVGLERIRCFHLNDSKGDVGKHLDRHDHVGEGKIGEKGFKNLLSDKRFVGVPMILETPKGDDDENWDEANLAQLHKWAKPVQ